MWIACDEIYQSSSQNVTSSQGVRNVPGGKDNGSAGRQPLQHDQQDLPVAELVVGISPLSPRLHRSSPIEETPVEAGVWFALVITMTVTIMDMGMSKKESFFGESFPKCGYVGWLILKQGPNPSEPPRKSHFFTWVSPFVFPNLTKTLGWVGSHIWKNFQKKTFFFSPSLFWHSWWK